MSEPDHDEGLRQLRQAIRSQDIEGVGRILDGRGFEARDLTPLLCEVLESRQREIAERLVGSGAPVAPDVRLTRESALAAAFASGDAGTVRWIVELGASIAPLRSVEHGVRDLWFRVFRHGSAELIDLALSLSEDTDLPDALSVAPDVAAFERVHARAPDFLRGEVIGPAFVSALTRGHPDVARRLVECGAVVGEIHAVAIGSLWASCVHASDVGIGSLILDAGFDIEAFERGGGSLIARLMHDMEKPKLLIPWFVEHGCDPNGKDESWGTPLFAALRAERLDAYRELLRHGAALDHPNEDGVRIWEADGFLQLEPEELRAMCGCHPPSRARLDVITRACSAELDAERLAILAEFGAPIDRPDEEDGRTALHHCIDYGWKKPIPTLLELGADPLHRDANGETPLDLVRRKTGFKKIAATLEKHVEASGSTVASPAVPLDPSEPWAQALLEATNGATGAWQELLALAFGANGTRPSQAYLKKARALLDSIGREAARDALLEALPRYQEERTARLVGDVDDDRYLYGGGDQWASSELNTAVLRGLLWATAHFSEPEMASALREVATAGFKKVPYVGMRNAKVGNAALNALASMGECGVRQIAILREQVKYNPAKVNIDRVFDRVSEELGVTTEELAESSISDFGLTECGRTTRSLGAHTAVLTILGPGRTELRWSIGDKTQKTVPAAVKRSHAAELKALKALDKDLQKATLAIREKLERHFLTPASWEPAEWRERYLDHPVAGTLGRRLIWRFEDSRGRAKSAMARDGGFIDASGAAVRLGRMKRVSLWHPMDVEVDEVLAWREQLVESETVQPFKQAHREVYVVTTAEKKTRNHSLRFAGHVVDQAQAHALATQRGWAQARGGRWDGGDETEFVRVVDAAGLAVRFDTEPMDELGASDAGIFLYLSTGKVAFHKLSKKGEIGAAVALAKVPPIVFSELMRDIDLIVSVANAGNDPVWEHRARMDDWSWHAAGELREAGKLRRAVLEDLVPRLAIADRLSLEDRFLRVEGTLSTYRIHLGSANVLMENGRYLCIVQRRRRGRELFLPFEGDAKLSEILSKAQLLVDDHKIRDGAIRSQIDG